MKTPTTYCGGAADTEQKAPILCPSSILRTLLACLLLFALLPAHAVKKIEANPINIAYMLAHDTDSVSMAKTCEYYGYTKQPSQGGYSVFTHKNGSIIRYTFKDGDSLQSYPYVEVKSKSGARDTAAILTNLGFKKEGTLYQQKDHKHTRSKFTCKHSSNGFLVFHKIHSSI